MKQKRRHKIALFFLLAYVPVAMSVSFFHSHGVPLSAKNQQVNTFDADGISVVNADLLCVICKFLSSHGSILDTSIQATIDPYSIDLNSFSTDLSSQSIFVLSDRAPPLFA